jgi:hypothetical protein
MFYYSIKGNKMEFYKTGKILGLTANQRLDLSSAVYNHKGAVIIGDGSQLVKLDFYHNGAVSSGITLAAGAINTNEVTNAFIPVRLAGVTPDDSNVQIVLFN